MSVNNDTKTIYVVTKGEYSCYGIVAIFDNKDDAQKLIELCSDDSYDEVRIEEYPLNHHSEHIRQGRISFWVCMRKDGTLVSSFPRWGYDSEELGFFKRLDGYDLYCTVFAKDEKHAIKIVNERRAQLIALGHWPKTMET